MDDKISDILSYLDRNRNNLNGWIWLDLIKYRCSLKKLSQYSGIKYNTLARAKKRLEKKLSNVFVTGGRLST